MELEFHDAANIFPLDEEHLDGLAADIAQHGQQQAIELMDGKILDGRRRYLACKRAGKEPRMIEVDVEDPVSYVLSLNLHRRHLTPSQASMVGARARAVYDKMAKDRMTKGRNQYSPVANLPQGSFKGKARDHVAKAVGVGGKSIDYATKVITSGVPELQRSVDEGRMAVSTAAILASEPEDVQRREVADPKRNRRYTSNVSKVAVLDLPDAEEKEEDGEIKIQGVGVMRAHDAINCLKQIPKTDALRKRGFQIVTDWIRYNQ